MNETLRAVLAMLFIVDVMVTSSFIVLTVMEGASYAWFFIFAGLLVLEFVVPLIEWGDDE